MQRFFEFSLILIFLGSVAAQGARSLEKSELSERLSYYRSISTLTTKFHETKTLKDMDLKIESDGELTVIRPSKVIWKVIKPSPLTVTLEETRMQIVGKDGKPESYAIDGAARDSLKTLVAWLKLDPDELFASYNITALGGEKYRFEPKKMDQSPVRAMEMSLRTGSYVERLKIDERSGDTLEIRFEKPRIEHSDGK